MNRFKFLERERISLESNFERWSWEWNPDRRLERLSLFFTSQPLVQIWSEWSKWWTFICVSGCNKKNRGSLQRVSMHAVVVDRLHQWFRRNLILYDNPRHEEIFIVVFFPSSSFFQSLLSLILCAAENSRFASQVHWGFSLRVFRILGPAAPWCMVMHAKTSPRDKVEETSLRAVRKKKVMFLRKFLTLPRSCRRSDVGCKWD